MNYVLYGTSHLPVRHPGKLLDYRTNGQFGSHIGNGIMFVEREGAASKEIANTVKTAIERIMVLLPEVNLSK